jgi:hypothetical protein
MASTKEPSLGDLLPDDEGNEAMKPPSLDDGDEEAGKDDDGDEAAETEVGQQMLDAVKADDPKAIYAAMKACIEMS